MKPILAACAICLMPIAGCASLSPNVNESSASDSDVIAHFGNTVLLSNILRARDYLPVNYSDLSSISQTTSLQASVGLSLPFGPLLGSTSRDTATPNVQATTSPTASIASLNNTGFVAAMITPVNPQYVVTKWNNEADKYSRELLLYLLIKSVELPAPDGDKDSITIVNDPQNSSDFDHIMNVLMKTNVDIEPKSITLMEALGPQFNFITTAKVDLGALSLATSLGDGQFHIGNGDARSKKSFEKYGQLYHVYPSQVFLCAAPDNLKTAYSDLFDEDYAKSKKANVAGIVRSLVTTSFAGSFALSSATAPGSTTSTTPASTPGGSSPSTSTPSAQIAQALTVSRISALVSKEDCTKDEKVVDFQPEATFADSTANFVHIEWRSPTDIIEYLGALLRNGGHTGGVSFGASTEAPADGKPYLRVEYDGTAYYFNGETLRALRIANELVNASKLASGSTISQPALFIP